MGRRRRRWVIGVGVSASMAWTSSASRRGTYQLTVLIGVCAVFAALGAGAMVIYAILPYTLVRYCYLS